ncbi:MAG: hypothetical protein ABI574_08370 [Burkholderiales bacterium]
MPLLRFIVKSLGRLIGCCVFGLCGLFAACSRDDPALWKRVNGQWTYDGNMFEAADPGSLKALDGRFARDAVRGYYRGLRVPDSHGPSFEVLGEHEARDHQAVYWADTYRDGQSYYMIRRIRLHVIEGADPARYQVLKYGYGRDSHLAFFEGRALKGILDPASFEVLTPRLARDARRAYFEDQAIEGSDGASFQIIDVHDDAWVRDRQHAWHVRVVLPGSDAGPRREVRLLDRALVESLKPLGRGYASDGRRVWWRGQWLKDADAATFTVLEESPASAAASSGAASSGAASGAALEPVTQPAPPGDARDARGTFDNGRRMAAAAKR